MKRLIKKQTIPPDKIHLAETDYNQDDESQDGQTRNGFSPTEIVDILQQIEELNDYNIAIRIVDGGLRLGVGDSIYEISPRKEGRYPRRRLRKIEP